MSVIMKYLLVCLLFVLLPVRTEAGWLWGPNNKTVVHNYGGATPATVYYYGAESEWYSPQSPEFMFKAAAIYPQQWQSVSGVSSTPDLVIKSGRYSGVTPGTVIKQKVKTRKHKVKTTTYTVR
jgi:hypothetical protein